MKKLIFALAAIALAACSNEETIERNRTEAIAFDQVFVDNSTRSVNDPSLTGANIRDFAVYGVVEGDQSNAYIFNNVKVEGSGVGENASWSYSDGAIQYWVVDAVYNFAAVAPASCGQVGAFAIDGSATTLSFTNTGTTDLLYAQPADAIVGKAADNKPVAFTFRHTLSKVKFSFENNYVATGTKVAVENIQITNAHETATATMSATTTDWADQTGEITLSFGDATDNEATTEKEETAVAYALGATYESENELLLIPSDSYAYNVTYTVKIYMGSTLIKTIDHTATLTFAPAPGTSYDVKAVLTAANVDEVAQEPIQFTVTAIDGWANGTVDNLQ